MPDLLTQFFRMENEKHTKHSVAFILPSEPESLAIRFGSFILASLSGFALMFHVIPGDEKCAAALDKVWGLGYNICSLLHFERR